MMKYLKKLRDSDPVDSCPVSIVDWLLDVFGE
jgi:hypothetical protein